MKPWQLALGDVVAVALFAPIGLLSHHEGITAAGLARNALPVAGGFLVAGLALRTWRPGASWRRLAAAWFGGVAAGVLVRAAILGHGYGRTTFTFMTVTLVVTGLLLLAWRGLLAVVRRRRARRRAGVSAGAGRV
jgi:hypothetical protein